MLSDPVHDLDFIPGFPACPLHFICGLYCHWPTKVHVEISQTFGVLSKRQRAGAVQDASRISRNHRVARSVLECGGPPPLFPEAYQTVPTLTGTAYIVAACFYKDVAPTALACVSLSLWTKRFERPGCHPAHPPASLNRGTHTRTETQREK